MENIYLENKISDLYEFEYKKNIEKLKLDLKRSNTLLKDAQKQLLSGNDHYRNRKLINQMKNIIEDAEHEGNSAIKIKSNLEEGLFELQDKLDEVTQLKNITDEKYFETSRENASLAAMVNDYEEELEEIMKKYKACVLALSLQHLTL